MPRFIASFASLLFAAILLTLVSGCERPVTSCAEFDPPPGKEATACPPKAAAIQAQPAQPARYCYSSLAQVECYAEPQPGRSGYLGSTEAPPPAETPAKAKGEKGSPAKPAAVQPAAAQPPAAPAQASPAPAASPATTAPTPLKPASAS
jgi:hypothetical protein